MGSRLVQGVILLFVLAGCAGVPFGTGSDATSRETLSPAPLDSSAESPDVDSTPLSVETPPGVSPDGSVNATRLRTGHSTYLEGRSYTRVLQYDADGTEAALRWDLTRRVELAGDSAFVEESGPSDVDTRTSYLTENGGYERTVTNNGTTIHRTDESSDAYANGGEIVEKFLAGLNPTVSLVEKNGGIYYRLFATGKGPPSTLREINTQVVDYRVTAYVTPDGLVQALVVEYERRSERDSQRVSIRLSYEAVGSTAVTPPAWVDSRSPPVVETSTADAARSPTPTTFSTGEPPADGSD